MLQDIRANTQGPVTKVVVWLIVISFAAFGIESILLGGGGNGIAEVNGEEITPAELQQAVNTQKRRLISMLGENFDPAILDDERLSAQALEGLISRKLLMQSAADMKLAVSERQIGLLVGSMEQFQIDGAFSPELYKSVLSGAGFTPAYFKQNLSDDLVVNQLRSGLAGSDFATAAELKLNARIIAEQRDVRYLTIPLESFSIDSEVAAEQVDAYYAENQSDFRTAETVDLEYIELVADAFRVPVDEAAVLEAYELEKNNFQYKTEHRVSHILFDDPADERIATAQERLAGGADFAEVAQEFSDDLGSANAGGDLGFTNGDAFPPEMEEVIAQLEPGVVSQAVQTDAGAHLIVVTERNEGKIPSLDEMRAQIEETLQTEEARVVLLRTVESLRDLSFNSEDLDGPASELDLTVSRADTVSRGQADGLFANPSLLAAAFSEEVLEAGHNSDVIELGGDHYVVLRMRTHNQAEIQPLEEVREQVVAIITDSNARTAVAIAAEKALQALRSGTSIEELATSAGYEWQVELGADRRNTAVPPGVLQRAFALPQPEAGQSSADYVMTATGDAQVFELARVTVGEYTALAETEQQGLRQQISGEYGGLVDTDFQRGLRASADISVL